MIVLRAAMALFCFGAVAYMVHRNIAHNWYSTGLMVQAYIVPIPIFLMGLFWAWWAWRGTSDGGEG